jgi:hypothetical protein
MAYDVIAHEEDMLVDPDLGVPASLAGALTGYSTVTIYNHLANGLLHDLSAPGHTARIAISEINERRVRPVSFLDLGRAFAAVTRGAHRQTANRRKRRQ